MIYPIRNIVAGVSSVTRPDVVLVAAIELAERLGAKLHLVHAHEIQAVAFDAYSQVGLFDATALQQYYDQRRSQMRALVRSLTGSVNVDFEVIPGAPAATILETAERKEADLILVGATRHGRVARALLGTTAQRVVRRSPVPVLIVREPLKRVERVLLTTDLSEFSGVIHEVGLDVVETLSPTKPELRSLHVTEGVSEIPFPIDPEVLSNAVAESTAKFLTKRRPRARSVGVAIRTGDPAEQIVEEAAAWKADLVVLGTHARKGATRWLLGSVGESAARDATCSVLMIPAQMEVDRLLPVPQKAHLPEVPAAH